MFIEGDAHVFMNTKQFENRLFYIFITSEMVMYPQEGSAMYMQTGQARQKWIFSLTNISIQQK
jgi:hypothetical protein